MTHKSYSSGFGSVPNKETNGHLYIANDNLKRIADTLEEILRLVKKDMEDNKKRWEYKPEEDNE